MEKEIILCVSTFPGYLQVQLKTLQTFQIKYFEIQWIERLQPTSYGQ